MNTHQNRYRKTCAYIAFGCAFVAGIVFGRMLPARDGSTPVAAAIDFQELPTTDAPQVNTWEINWRMR